ncbi:hypothetical protein MA16_Dca023847 [Dendrobium catenatum]|uniref:Uncharacterized protein n=1 Tax=Dendrobium catenatum TaxID=906689 RepID=A0A2I0VDP7_9ASPA|nr:hypothetical protein MA16_Dca023847 [Dendrobium catenatum]
MQMCLRKMELLFKAAIENIHHLKNEEGLSSFLVQPKKIDIAISKEVHGDDYLMQFVEAQKLEEQVLMGLR